MPINYSRRNTDVIFISVLVLLVAFTLFVASYRPSLQARRDEKPLLPDTTTTIVIAAKKDSIKTPDTTITLAVVAKKDSIKTPISTTPVDWERYVYVPPTIDDWYNDAHPYQIPVKQDIIASLDTIVDDPEDTISVRIDSGITVAFDSGVVISTGNADMDSLIKKMFGLGNIIAQKDSLLSDSTLPHQRASLDTTITVTTTTTTSQDDYSEEVLLPEELPIKHESLWLAYLFLYVLLYYGAKFVYTKYIGETTQKSQKKQLKVSDLPTERKNEEIVNRMFWAAALAAISGIMMLLYAPGIPHLVNFFVVYFVVLSRGMQHKREETLWYLGIHHFVGTCTMFFMMLTFSQGVVFFALYEYTFDIFLIIFNVFLGALLGAIVAEEAKDKKKEEALKKEEKALKNQQDSAVVVDATLKQEQPQKKQPQPKKRWWSGRNLQELTNLNLSNRNISSNDEETFDHISECELLVSLDLSRNKLTEIPYEIEYLEHLKHLNLSHNKITDAETVDFSACTQLTHIDLSNNKLTQIPDELLALQQLEVLNIENNPILPATIEKIKKKIGNPRLELIYSREKASEAPRPEESTQRINNENAAAWELIKTKLKSELKKPKEAKYITSLINIGLTTVPEELFVQLPNIVFLSLASNPLKVLPKAILEAKNTLKTLHIEHCQLTEIPDFVVEMQQLTTLGIGGNSLQEFPKHLLEMPALRELKVDDLKSIPPDMLCQELEAFTHLEKLSVRGIDFSNEAYAQALSKLLPKLERLTSLDISFCKLQQMPQTVFQLSKLQELYMSGNQFEELPHSDWARLPALRTLFLGYNKISILTESFFRALAEVGSLYTLDLGGFKMEEVPEWLPLLRQVKSMGLQNNEISYLPQEMLEMTLLVSLNVSNNKLGFLPEKIDKLFNLEYFYAERNHIQTLPDAFMKLPKLRSISLPAGIAANLRKQVEDKMKQNKGTVRWG